MSASAIIVAEPARPVNLNLHRRYRRFRLDPDGLMALLKGETPACPGALPADAHWITWGWDHNYQALIVVVDSSTFDAVPLDREIPFDLGGPVVGRPGEPR